MGTTVRWRLGGSVPRSRCGPLGWPCGQCRFCVAGQETLCAEARFTGCDLDGGYAGHAVADARYCFALPEAYIGEAAAFAAVREADRVLVP